ncbi:transcriptional regulator ATRX homolog [Lutzomyia longipalpis]|uniref:transcriptional regulator ATRX homolog n=1 Tax=Lutzomyia longipalpis TaxID=7200 RepID=UPI0024835357|nr:transcriptional regulator ATRX homolog [Lutzomyia longipalpis]XP_055695301.1 transcriptional regulator ATRX homolog [Lutzomyia longipalpis]XP_055695302.1 transcriptional regulator ATRX homolog [Lutzomyia longipalpis]XP_055695303.1 transcriptional regulator ATRX homolog [Lutzomyia longipalpis]
MDDSSLCQSIGKHFESIRSSLEQSCDTLEKSQSDLCAKDSGIPFDERVDSVLTVLREIQGKITKTIDRATTSVRTSIGEWKGNCKTITINAKVKEESTNKGQESEENSDGDKPKIRVIALEKLQDPTLLSNNRLPKSRLKQRPTAIPQKLNKSSIVISDSSDDEPIHVPLKSTPRVVSSEVEKHAKSVKVQVKALPEDLAVLKRQHKVTEIRNSHGALIEKLSEAAKEPIKLVIKNPSKRSDKSTEDKDSDGEESSSDEIMNGKKKITKRVDKRVSSEDSTAGNKETSEKNPDKRESSEKSSEKKQETSEVEKKKPSKGLKDSDEEVPMSESESKVGEINGKGSDDRNSDNSTDSEIIVSRKKRKRAQSNSTKGSNSSTDSDSVTKPTRKRRIKRPKNSDSSDDEKKTEKSPDKNKRKNIRKVLKDRDLEDDTKKAAREESERKKRIEERQKMYNEIYEVKDGDAVKELDKVVLDFEEESKEDLLSVHKDLVKKLKPHQGMGIKFMWDACFETLERSTESDGSGCILAHCMGLGKTLQVIALTHTLLANSEKTGVQRVLVICPLSTVLNWVNEFSKWLDDVSDSEDIDVYELSKQKQNNDRANVIRQWHTGGGVLVIGYDLFRNLSNEKNRNIKKKARESIQMGLINPGPELVICDEGHLLKNEKTSLSKAVNKIRTLRRIVLTGTPLQNNLKEYYCMVQFVKPNLLGKYNEYMNRFVNPITNGQYIDSTPRDIQIMKRRSHVLHKMLDGCVQRRDYSVLAPFLPPKHEYVVFIRLTELQIKLYKYYMENKARSADEGGSKRTSILFADFQNLQRIWTHPRVLRYNSDRYEINQQKKRDLMDDTDESVGSLKDFIDDETSSAASSDSDSGSSNSSAEKKPVKRTTRNSRMLNNEPLFEPSQEQMKIENPTEWWVDMVPESDLDNLKVSGKLMMLFSILEECEAIGDKLLVFSQSLFSLDVIEHFLSLVDDNEQAKKVNPLLAGFAGSWSLGLDYFRLDGSTAIEHRNAAIKQFNQVDNHRARLFLISTRAGGLGVNLVAANRVVIFDASWNPSHDVQSIFRVYRFGQVKPCYIYRFLALGTMEEKIYERQVTKQAISKRVIDEQQIDRHYRENDLMLLYNYDLEPQEPRETPNLPKDRLFADMLTKYEDLIYKYHEHDSLLENKEEETLNEEERRAAWEEYEAEKKRVPVINYGMMGSGLPMGTFNVGNVGRAAMTGHVTSNNYFGFRGDIFLRLLDLKTRQDHPEFDEMQIKAYIPVLVQQMYNEVSRGDMTTYNDLIVLQQELIDAQSPQIPNIYQNYNSQYIAGSSGNLINPYHPSFNQNRQNFGQNNQLSGNNFPSDNGVINID